LDANERNEILKAGIEAAQNGNNITARSHFRRILEQNPEDEQVWLYMVRVVDTKEDKQRCLEKVLDINPNNETAKAAAERLGLTLRGSRGGGGVRDSLDDLRQSAASSFDDSPQTTYSGATGSITTAGKSGTEQKRDWFQPVDRGTRPPELWQAQQSRPNWLLMGLVGVIAIGFIGLAILLIINQLNDDDSTAETLSEVEIESTETQAVLDAVPTVPPTLTETPRPTVIIRQTQLPPTQAPVLTNTPLPSPTNTRTPNPPSSYRLLFSASLFPFDGEPYHIFTILGDGTDMTELNISLPDVDVLPAAAPTEASVSDATDVPDDEEGDGGDEATDTPTEEPQADPTVGIVELIDPSYSPDGQFIVFTAQVGTIQELFVVSATGTGLPRQLTMFSSSQTRDAEWSPDGSRIVFSSDVDGDNDIYLINANATNAVVESADVTKLTLNDVIVDREPTWSPDGQYLAFQSDRMGGASFQIFVIPVQGDQICQMTDSTGSNMTPDWSPDGSEIAFISSRDGDNDLFLMRSDGTNERSITVGDGDWQERDPQWSPDQQWIVVSSTRVEGGSTASANPTSKLWVLTPDGKEWRGVSIGDSNDLDASWLPSGDSADATDFVFECAAAR
jgi:Tol biopolymer transport system component